MTSRTAEPGADAWPAEVSYRHSVDVVGWSRAYTFCAFRPGTPTCGRIWAA